MTLVWHFPGGSTAGWGCGRVVDLFNFQSPLFLGGSDAGKKDRYRYAKKTAHLPYMFNYIWIYLRVILVYFGGQRSWDIFQHHGLRWGWLWGRPWNMGDQPESVDKTGHGPEMERYSNNMVVLFGTFEPPSDLADFLREPMCVCVCVCGCYSSNSLRDPKFHWCWKRPKLMSNQRMAKLSLFLLGCCPKGGWSSMAAREIGGDTIQSIIGKSDTRILGIYVCQLYQTTTPAIPIQNYPKIVDMVPSVWWWVL